MKQTDSGSVYRICAVDQERWEVLRGASAERVATFNDKHAALAYAMNLARAKSSWQLHMGLHSQALRSIFNQPRIHE